MQASRTDTHRPRAIPEYLGLRYQNIPLIGAKRNRSPLLRTYAKYAFLRLEALNWRVSYKATNDRLARPYLYVYTVYRTYTVYTPYTLSTVYDGWKYTVSALKYTVYSIRSLVARRSSLRILPSAGIIYSGMVLRDTIFSTLSLCRKQPAFSATMTT